MVTGRGASDGVYGLEPMMRTWWRAGLGVAAAARWLSGWRPVPLRPATIPVPAATVGRDIPLTPDTTLVSGLVPRSTTLDALLRGHGVADEAALGVVNAAREVFDPRRLRALQPFALERTVEGTIRFFQYEIDNDRFLRIAPASAESRLLDAAVVPIPKTLEHATAAGRIDRQTPSLFQSVSSAGEGAELAVALADIFSGEIDFNSDVQPGDAYALAFDKYTREGGAVELRRHHRGRVPQRRPRAARHPLHRCRAASRRITTSSAARCAASSCARRSSSSRGSRRGSRRAGAIRCCTRRARIAGSTTPRPRAPR